MYAVIRTGGKQYRVAKDDVISVEKLAAEAGATVELDQVLMIGGEADATVGAPLVDGARVVATVLEQTRGDKVIVFKKRRRKGYRRTQGHRQDLTVLRINAVLTEAVSKPAKAKAKPEAKTTAGDAKPAKPRAVKSKIAKADAAGKSEDAKAPAKAQPPAKAKSTPAKARSAPAKAKSAPAKAKKALDASGSSSGETS